ncbi:MAG: ParB N-terminal domain-containing protein, partial [Bacteroidales bacterium]
MNKPAVEMVATDKLIPYARNAKKHDEAQVALIAGSIRQFGFNNPILIAEDNGIVAGHGRVLAAMKLGLAEVPCIRLSHLDENQRRAYILADNRLAELGGGWDLDMLAAEMDALGEVEIDVGELGFDEAFLSLMDLTETESGVDAEAQIDKAEELREKWGVKLGDLWQLGEHRLICGDCTDKAVVERVMQGERAELLLTDPPYNLGFDYGKNVDD